MAESTNVPETNSSVRGTIAVVLARVVVPLWLFVGAVLKLVDLSPTHLPAALIKWCGGLGMDLMFVLRFSIVAELIVVGIMVFLPPLARWTGIVVLGAFFLPVLIGDLMLGASSCGCFGAVAVSPWITLVMDVTFFVGLLFLGRGEPRLALTPSLSTSRALTAGVWSILSVVISFGLGSSAPPAVGDPSGSLTANETAALPADGYYMPSYDEWIGRPFQELEIASWISGLPEDLNVGQQFVIFYRKDCEHCHELMAVYFVGELPGPTTAVAVPDRTGFPTENVQPFECDECARAELPMGVDWFIQTPALVRLMDGVVECAAEVDSAAPDCLGY